LDTPQRRTVGDAVGDGRRPSPMPKTNSAEETAEAVLALLDLEHAKTRY
jgi:hypothetical protein